MLLIQTLVGVATACTANSQPGNNWSQNWLDESKNGINTIGSFGQSFGSVLTQKVSSSENKEVSQA